MKSLLTTLFFLFSTTAISGTAMKLEGSCSGNLADGSRVALTYYSNFDGCKDLSSAAVSFSEGHNNGLTTGKRGFSNGKDIYRFKVKNKEIVRLTFADSTGNTSGKLTYRDDNDNRKTVVLQCAVRDYSYGECE